MVRVRCFAEHKGETLWVRVVVVVFREKGDKFLHLSQVGPVAIGRFLIYGAKFNAHTRSEELVYVLDCFERCGAI